MRKRPKAPLSFGDDSSLAGCVAAAPRVPRILEARDEEALGGRRRTRRMATAGRAHGVTGGVAPARQSVEPELAPGRRTLVGDEVGTQPACPTTTPKLPDASANQLAADLTSALEAVRDVRAYAESRREAADSPEPWRYAMFAATEGVNLTEAVVGAKLAGLDTASIDGPDAAAVMSTEALLETFLDDLRRRVDALQVTAAVVARSGVDVGPALRPALAELRKRFDAIGGNAAIAAFAVRATTVIARAAVTPGVTTRVIEIASDTPLGVSPPGSDATRFYGGVAVGTVRGIAAAVVDTFRGIELVGELTAAMLATLLSGHAIATILAAAGRLAEAVSSHPLEKLGAAFALQWMQASDFGRGEICGKIVG